jgi:vitamin B12 transporter
LNLSRSHSAAAGNFYGPFPGRKPKALSAIIGLTLLLFLLTGAWNFVQAQTNVRIAGQVYDAVDGHPIERAAVRIQGSEFTTFTDQFGRFVLEHIPEGRHRLEFSAFGYKPATSDEIDVVSDITRRLTIRLERDAYDLGEREVRGQAPPLPPADLEIIDRSQIEESEARSLADVLNQLEGVYIQESGPVGGEKQVSIRGSAPKHVLVLLDGRRLNPAGSGEADLNSIPLEIVEKIEIYRGGQSALFGGDALGGVINIVTRTNPSQNGPELKVHSYRGKWNTGLHDVTISNPIRTKGLATKFTYGYRETRGDFDYNYVVLPRPDVVRAYSGTRLNSFHESRNYFFSGSYQQIPATILHFSGQVYQSEQGLPGPISQPELTSRKEDHRLLGAFQLQHDFSSRHHLESSLGFTRLIQQFEDEENRSPYRSRYTNDIADCQITSRYRISAGNDLSGGVALHRDILYHDELLNPGQSGMGRTVRDNIGLFVTDRQVLELNRIPFWDMMTLDVSLRWDNTDTKKDADAADHPDPVYHISHWSRKAGVSVSRGEKTRLIVRASYGTSYRLPSINALFWKGDVLSQGNPDLRPEQSEHSDVGFEITTEGPVNFSAGITYFHSYVTDLIVWRPSSPLGIWRPENLAAAQITGHEDFIRIGFLDDRVRLTYGNTVTNALNKTRASTMYNKFLTFRPHYVTNLGCELQLWKFHGAYQIRLVDIRYALDANTKWYGAYRVENADLGFETGISHFTVEVDYQVRNLGGEDYVLMAHYPMPGREWGVRFSLSYRPKQ